MRPTRFTTRTAWAFRETAYVLPSRSLFAPDGWRKQASLTTH